MGCIRLTYRDMRGVEDADKQPPQPENKLKHIAWRLENDR
jgi:hypothetical protein